jgi:DNA-binding IclR family transcriptional regulator
MPTRQLRIPPPLHPGLMEEEVLVLEMVIRAGGMSPVEVARQTGLSRGGTDLILERLVQLKYVSHKGSRFQAEPRTRAL